MNDTMNNTIQPEQPNIIGLSHICIFVDDMEQAVDYYRDLLGVQPDHCLSHWRNEGFFKAGGFVEEAAEGDVSIAFVNVPGTKLTLELMQYHYPKGRTEPVTFAANDVSGARHVALKVTNIEAAFAHIQAMPDTRLINETEAYKVYQISETQPSDVHFRRRVKPMRATLKLRTSWGRCATSTLLIATVCNGNLNRATPILVTDC